MPALTITAVDHTTDQLTIVGHGLLTGAGPAAVRNVGGAHPNPLAEVTDYWVIRVDANTVKLATSSANALAATAIALTTNGTGTNILEVGIPYRRARTYVARAVDVAGAQLKSADLNSKMDSLQALHALLTGQTQSIWTMELVEAPALYYTEAIPVIIPGARAIDSAGVHTALNAASGCRVGFTLAADTAPLTYPIEGLRDGDVITAWSVAIDKGSASGGAFQGWLKSLHATTYVEADEAAGTGIQNGGGPITGWAIGESGLNILVSSAKQYYLDVDPNASCAGDDVYSATVWVKRPRP